MWYKDILADKYTDLLIGNKDGPERPSINSIKIRISI